MAGAGRGVARVITCVVTGIVTGERPQLARRKADKKADRTAERKTGMIAWGEIAINGRWLCALGHNWDRNECQLM
ncbi:hypothetical protein DC008_20285 [Streptomyces nigra]|nr:hypothetical protein DC008_20285 [Streptomyces nigra]